MRSAVFYGKHDLRVEEYPLPELGAKDVLIQVKACGICGTDVHIYEGDKVAVIFKDNGQILAIGNTGEDAWIDTTDKFVKKTFAELNIVITSLKVY